MTSKQQNSQKPDLFIPVVATLFVIIMGVWFFVDNTNCQITNDAVIEGKLLTVCPKVPGYALHVYTQENQEVKKGDLLAELDSTYYESRLREAETKLKSAKAKLFLKEREEGETSNNFISKFSFSKHRFSDYEKNYEEEMVPTQTEEEKRACLTDSEPKATEKSVKQNPEQKDEMEEQEETKEELIAEIKRLEAEIEQAKLDLSYTKVYAPQDGIVSVNSVREGDYVEAGQTIISVIPKHVWVFAKFDELQTTDMREGQAVIVKLKKYPRKNFKAVVDNIQKNHNLSDGIKVPVKIMFTEDYSQYEISPGTTATVKVKMGRF